MRFERLYPRVTTAVLIFGASLHVYSIVFGHEKLLRDFFTPPVDIALSIPMTFAGVCYWVYLKRVDFRNLVEKCVYFVTGFYVAASIPLHIRTLVTWDTSYINRFPESYSYFILPVMLVLSVFAWRVRFKSDSRERRGRNSL
jgi:hypothetical protein